MAALMLPMAVGMMRKSLLNLFAYVCSLWVKMCILFLFIFCKEHNTALLGMTEDNYDH